MSEQEPAPGQRPDGTAPRLGIVAGLLIAAQILWIAGLVILWMGWRRLNAPNSELQTPARAGSPQPVSPDEPAPRSEPSPGPASPGGWAPADQVAFAEAGRFAAGRQETPKVFARYRRFLGAFPDSAYAAPAREALRQTRAAFQEEAAQALALLLAARDRAERQGSWVRAVASLDRFPVRFARTHAARRAEQEKRLTLERLAQWYFARERRARSLALAGRHEEAARQLAALEATGFDTIDARCARLRDEFGARARARAAEKARQAAAARKVRIAREMGRFAEKLYEWARLGKFDDARRYAGARLNEPDYADYHGQIRRILEDVAGIARFQQRIAANLAGLVGHRYRFTTVTRLRFEGEVTAIKDGRIHLKSGSAETAFELARLDITTWVRIGKEKGRGPKGHGPKGHGPHAEQPTPRVTADAGLYLLCRGHLRAALEEFREAAPGIAWPQAERYLGLVEKLMARGAVDPPQPEQPQP